jgi:ATP-dependent phosphoenolpyruvate carboxykinase
LPQQTWPDRSAYRDAARKLAAQFEEHFSKYADHAMAEVRSAGPKL